MAKRIRRAFVGLPDILICGVAYYVTLLQDVSFLLKTTSRRIFTCICALHKFTFPQVYSIEQGENFSNKTVLHAASVMKYEVHWTSHRGSKEADEGRVSKEDQFPTSEFFMCRFLRIRFAHRKTRHMRDIISTSVVTVNPAMLQRTLQEIQHSLGRLQGYEPRSKVGTYDINTLL
jgi:hypothetical protein